MWFQNRRQRQKEAKESKAADAPPAAADTSGAAMPPYAPLTMPGAPLFPEAPLSDGALMDRLNRMGLAVTVIPDSAVGFIMERLDCVLVGAEAVVRPLSPPNVDTYMIHI